MKSPKSLSHTAWECKYQVVWIPKCGRKILDTSEVLRFAGPNPASSLLWTVEQNRVHTPLHATTPGCINYGIRMEVLSLTMICREVPS